MDTQKERKRPFPVIATLFIGILLGSATTQLMIPRTGWRSCRQLGIDTASRTHPLGPPNLELFAQQEDEAVHLIRVNGTYSKPSPFRGPTSPAVDASWAKYWETWIFSIDEDMLQHSVPQYPDASVRLADGRYMATFEATHQLHCLYNLFRASYRDSYPEEEADYQRNSFRWHERVDHCVEVLRQKLECDRDTTLMTYNWVAGKRDPVLNFNSARMCPEWARLDDFAQRFRVDRMPRKPGNAVELAEIP